MNEHATISGVIENAGGIGGRADLARRWGISMTRIHQLARSEGFPEPVVLVAEGRVPIYSLVECDAWRRDQQSVRRGVSGRSQASRGRSRLDTGSWSGGRSVPSTGRTAPPARVQPTAPDNDHPPMIDTSRTAKPGEAIFDIDESATEEDDW